MPTSAPTKRPAAGATKAAAVGQPVWFYSDRDRARGMKSVDDSAPFAAIVASSVSDRLVNVLVVDHIGTTFALQDVPLFQGDDQDDLAAPYHCELNAPAPRETIALTGAAGQLIPLNLGATVDTLIETGAVLASVKLAFTVPPGNAYTFSSVKGPLSQSFSADPKRQTLVVTAAQIAAGALTDLSLTTDVAGNVLLAVTATEQGVGGASGHAFGFNEAVTVSAPPPVAEQPIPPPAPGPIAAASAPMGAPPPRPVSTAPVQPGAPA
jgi:hypothetical protein